jgi:hypothetical protein
MANVAKTEPANTHPLSPRPSHFKNPPPISYPPHSARRHRDIMPIGTKFGQLSVKSLILAKYLQRTTWLFPKVSPFFRHHGAQACPSLMAQRAALAGTAGDGMTLQVGQFVRFNARGVGWATNRCGAPERGQSVEWNGRLGQVGRISRDKTLVRVQWQGCKSLSDYLPAKFVENG